MSGQPFLALITPIGSEVPPLPPLGTWGPTDPRPTNPIAGWNPGTGTFPPYQPPYVDNTLPLHPFHPIVVPPGGAWPSPPQPPLGFWGPGTLPLHPFNPIVVPPGGTWPSVPGTVPPTATGHPGQLPASDPSGSGWVFCFVPGYGWMWAQVPPPPATAKPVPPTEEVPPTTPA